MLGQAVHVRGSNEVQVAKRLGLLHQAKSHYCTAIDLAHKCGSAHVEAAAYLNRGIARSFLSESNADEDFGAARRLAPQDSNVMQKHAMHLAEVGELSRAIDEARAALFAKPGNESSVFLAALLWDRNQGNDRNETLALCLAVIRGGGTERFDQALEITVVGLATLMRWDEALAILELLSAEKISLVALQAFRGYVYHTQGDQAAAEAAARASLAAVDDRTLHADLRRLSRLLDRLNLHSLALPLLERIAKPGQFDNDSRSLLDCANRLRNHRVILKVCRELREAGVEDRRLLDNEVNILQLYNRPAAIEILQSHLARNSDDRMGRLRLAILGLQGNRPELITADLNQLPSVDEVQPALAGRAVIGVLEKSERWGDAISYAYNLLRRNMSDPDAHLLYCNLIVNSEREGWPIRREETVQEGVAIAYRESGDSHIQWVVVEEDDPDPLLDEYSVTHARVQHMIGKKVGDVFTLSSGGIQDRTAEILSIDSKYVHRFQECLNQFQVRFPDRGDLQQVRLARQHNSDNQQLDISPILRSLDQHHHHVMQTMGIYRSQPTPLNLLVNAVGKNLFQTMLSLTNHLHGGIRWCCFGTAEEKSDGLSACRENKDIVLDLTALFTIWQLSLFDVLRGWDTRRFLVSQSTFDKLRDIVESESMPGPRRHMGTDAQGRYVFSETPADSLTQYIDSLRRLVAFVEEHCSVGALPELADAEPDQRERIAEIVDRDGLESIVLGARAGHVLWTDDGTLGILARQEFASTRRCWTQLFLQAAVDEGKLQKAAFDDYSARLIGLGYSFTWCSPTIVLRAGVIASWQCGAFPLRQAIGQFGLDSIQPSDRLGLAAQVIVAMYKETVSPFTRCSFVLAILNQLASRRLAVALANGLSVLFGLDVHAAAEAIGTIRQWLRGPIVLS